MLKTSMINWPRHGDSVLIKVANEIKNSPFEDLSVYRLGGEEVYCFIKGNKQIYKPMNRLKSLEKK